MNMTHPEIRFVKNKQIDRQKWDESIRNSPFGIAYAYSWFLDRICRRWDALIWGDYQYIMPLVNNSKFGISYIYQPFFTQQLGVFAGSVTEPEIVNKFLHAVPQHFRLIDMRLNLGNEPTTTQFIVTPNTTHHLRLNSGKELIQSGYNTNTKRNIQKAIQNKVIISPVNDIQQFLKFTQQNIQEKSPEIKSRHYAALQSVISYALNDQLGEISGAWDSDNNLIAAAFFLSSNQKSIYLAASSNAKGTEQSAMFLLIDSFIQRNAGKELILDFEGSNIAGVARFYAGFGGKPQTYFSIHQNRLPILLRYLKK